MIRVAILGATGSIGTSALSVAEAHPDRVRVVGLAAATSAEALAPAVRAHRPTAVSMATDQALARLAAAADLPAAQGVGDAGLVMLATRPDVDLVLCASSGTAALEAVLAAIDAGKAIALANKEVLVMAGGLVMDRARAKGVAILPVDSEHNAIHQCLHGHATQHVKRLILTASGGPFRGRTRASLAAVTPADALRHPTWQMGPKITVDSATLMNKGLEVIEAHWLFGVTSSQIDVVVHPQSIVHSLVEFTDGSMLAQLGTTDMRLPIQYAFSYPDRWHTPVPHLDLARAGTLEFHPPAWDEFPCLRLAFRALDADRSLPIVLNAANEVAVASFLAGQLGFTAIADVIAATMDAHRATPVETLPAVRAVDAWAKAHALELVRVESEKR
ncbi:MAG: 1-deoxy-D-xylulose-5-phosphate reductoisomerase [Acidobacteria bacterium]|nr:1-deoxy-D-xylulose-5-phosphate reductoisomerase [Acidobacteriota bacterium]